MDPVEVKHLWDNHLVFRVWRTRGSVEQAAPLRQRGPV